MTSREGCAKVVSSRDDREPKLRVVNMTSNRVEDRLLTVADVAEYLGLSVGTVYNKVSRGEIPHVKLGRAVRFRRSEIDRWIDAQSRVAEDAA